MTAYRVEIKRSFSQTHLPQCLQWCFRNLIPNFSSVIWHFSVSAHGGSTWIWSKIRNLSRWVGTSRLKIFRPYFGFRIFGTQRIYNLFKEVTVVNRHNEIFSINHCISGMYLQRDWLEVLHIVFAYSIYFVAWENFLLISRILNWPWFKTISVLHVSFIIYLKNSASTQDSSLEIQNFSNDQKFCVIQMDVPNLSHCQIVNQFQ